MVVLPGRYVYDVQLTANEALNSQRKAIDNDSDFAWRGISASCTGTFSVRFNDGAGFYFTTGMVQSVFLTAITGLPGPYVVWPEALFKAGSYIGIDLLDTSGQPNKVQIVFWGVRRYKNVDQAIKEALLKN